MTLRHEQGVFSDTPSWHETCAWKDVQSIHKIFEIRRPQLFPCLLLILTLMYHVKWAQLRMSNGHWRSIVLRKVLV